MSKFEKQLEKMRSHPQDWRIEELKRIADRLKLSIGNREQVM